MIYVIRDTGTGLVKIGTTKDPWRRLAMLQTGAPSALEMILIIEGGREQERAIHAELETHRVRSEWFACEGAVKRFLAHHGAVAPLNRPRSAHGQWARVARACGISEQLLCEIRSGRRFSPIVLAQIFQQTGLKVGRLERVSDVEAAQWSRVMLAISDDGAAEAREAA